MKHFMHPYVKMSTATEKNSDCARVFIGEYSDVFPDTKTKIVRSKVTGHVQYGS